MMTVKSLKYFLIRFSSTWLYDLFWHDVVILYLLVLLYSWCYDTWLVTCMVPVSHHKTLLILEHEGTTCGAKCHMEQSTTHKRGGGHV